MKKFIALDIENYKLMSGITPINLTWKNNTIKDWCRGIKFTKKDIVIGHSLGAAVALIVAKKTPPNELHLYSPSPIFTETIKFLDKKNLDYFGKRRQKEIEPIPSVDCPVYIYYGTDESSMMKKTAIRIATKLPNSKLVALTGRNHQTVINQDKIWFIHC